MKMDLMHRASRKWQRYAGRLALVLLLCSICFAAGDAGLVKPARGAGGEPPMIYGVHPADMAFTSDRTPTITAVFERGEADIDLLSLSIGLDGKNVTGSAQVSFDPAHQKGSVSFTPELDLSRGEHDVIITVSDKSGQTRQYAWFFAVDGYLSSSPHFYYGNPHSHTSFSDGQGTPAQAYDHAYNEWLDFLAVTDHSDMLEGDCFDPGKKEFTGQAGSEWTRTADMARAFNTAQEDFLALRGFEMTFPELGHMNILNTDKYVEAVNSMTSLSECYDWLARQPGAIAQFNHPGWPETSFDNLAYSKEADRIINAIEVGNGSIPYSYTRFEACYYKALDNGWHVGAVNAQDNHAPNWGDADNLTMVVADQLNMDEFSRAFRERRIYATESRSLRLTYKGNGHWMGSVIDLVPGEPLNLEILVEDKINPIADLTLITNGGIIVATHEVNGTAGEWHHQVIPGTGSHWYVVKVVHKNGRVGFSSPVFTTN